MFPAPRVAAAAPRMTSATYSLHLRVLYLFAGRSRQADMGCAYRSLVLDINRRDTTRKVTLEVEEIDVLLNLKIYDLL